MLKKIEEGDEHGSLKRISSIFKNYVPGNVKGIPKRYEKKFLVVSGIICFLYASVYLILVRIQI
ncbi:MAG: hypothetical protein ACTSWV_03800 [Candidatus Asgardarchaeia archaeon]